MSSDISTELDTPVAADSPQALLESLVAEVRRLRAMVAALSSTVPKTRISLGAVRNEAYLGQPMTIVATVTDALERTPLDDMPVTFISSWGRLHSVENGRSVVGQSITARSGIDGIVRVTLRPPTAEDFWAIQQNALEAQLGLLDPGASSPADTQAGLFELARQYRWEANIHFRRAVDILFRDFRPRILETINFHDFLQQWRYFDATVMALAVSTDTGNTPSTADCTAALRLRIRDWLGPWLQSYQELLKSENPLAGRLQDVKSRSGDAAAIVDGVFSEVQKFVAHQRGAAGKLVGEQLSQSSVREFLDSGVDDLPQDTRSELFSPLKIASQTVASSGVSVLKGMSQTRVELRQEIDARVNAVDADTLMLSKRLALAETQLKDKVDASIFKEFEAKNAQAIEKLANNNVALSKRVDIVETQLIGKVSASEFEQFQAQTKQSLATKVNTATFNARIKAVEIKLDELGRDRPPPIS